MVRPGDDHRRAGARVLGRNNGTSVRSAAPVRSGRPPTLALHPGDSPVPGVDGRSRRRDRRAGGGPGVAHRQHDLRCRRPPPGHGARPHAGGAPGPGHPRSGAGGLARGTMRRTRLGLGQVGPAQRPGGADRPTRAGRYRPGTLRRPGRAVDQRHRRPGQLLRPVPPPAVPGRHRPGHRDRRDVGRRLDIGA